MNTTVNRRDFLRQTFAYSALAALGSESLLAQPPNVAAQHVLMVGDWGWTKLAEGQERVGAAMVAYARKNALNTHALFMLGDNWYGNLDGGVDSPRWNSGFEDIYPSSAFPGPAYAIMGNHDYQHMPPNVNKVEAELAYAKRGHSRWTQPGLWYTLDINSKDKNEPLLHIIALDSNAPKKDLDPASFTLSRAQYNEQLKWLEVELAKPTKAPFRIVMGHHPIFSNGKHGDTAPLVRDWEPLLRRHKVHAYLAGHDHDLQHLEFEGHPTSFVCSGGGGADLYDINEDRHHDVPFAEKIYGFTHLEATPSLLTFRHIDSSCKVLHAFTKSLDGKVTLLK